MPQHSTCLFASRLDMRRVYIVPADHLWITNRLAATTIFTCFLEKCQSYTHCSISRQNNQRSVLTAVLLCYFDRLGMQLGSK